MVISALLVSGGFFVSVFAAPNTQNGFDQYGYNDKARVFVGTGSSWCQGKFGWTQSVCVAYLGDYANDKLVMKWNKAIIRLTHPTL